MTVPSLQALLYNFSVSYPWLERLLFATSYMLGLGMLFRATYQLKIYGELRTMMASHTNIGHQVALIVAGVCLTYLPSAIYTFTYQLFGYTNPLQYMGSSTQWHNSLTIVGLFVQFVGLLAFIRGWMILSNLGKQGGQPAFGKGMTHVIGGILAMNIWGTVRLFSSAFGWNG